MKRVYVILALLAFSLAGMAQEQKKWKAPKRPKRPKWEAPRQVAPEVIDVWRPYNASDNWMLDFYGGWSMSMAENMSGHGIAKMGMPMFDLGIGKQFSKIWSTRLTLGYRRQKGWASDEALAVSTLLGDGDYTFGMAALYVDQMMSFTNLFCPYNERRRLDVQMFLGAGLNYSLGFDEKTKRWSRLGYPVDGSDHMNLAVRGGLLCLFKLNETTDIMLQGVGTMVGDSHNGVKHSKTFALEPYAEVALGVRVHLMDHYGDYRFYKVRRWEATALRTADERVAELLDNEKLKEYQDREASEVVAFGELMKTRISFYVDRVFVNDYQMENLRIVADFLKKHPDVNLLIKGYCGASVKSESPDMHLAERRVESVKKALVRYYNVDVSRFETWFDEKATPPFPMKGEWIDGVVFVMRKR